MGFIRRHIRSLSTLALALVSMILIWVTFGYSISVTYPSLIGTTMKVVGDCVFFLIPYWFVSPRWRWSVVLPVWFYGLWAVCNSVYYNFFGDLISPSAMTMTSNVNGELFSYFIANLKHIYILYILAPVVLSVAIYFIRPGRDAKFSVKGKVIGIFISLVLVAAGQFSYYRSHISWLSMFRDEALKTHYNPQTFNPISVYTISGLDVYAILYPVDMYRQLSSDIELTDDQRKMVQEFIGSNTKQVGENQKPVTADSTNIVFIIVESLNADVFNRHVNGLEITPVLDSLATLPGTVTINNIVPQVDIANSGDGRLILLTGLLPTRDIPYCYRYGGKNKFYSLPEALPGYHSLCVMPETGAFWNAIQTFENWGIQDIYDIDDMETDEEHSWLDKIMFEFASSKIKNIERPFFMLLISQSMHWPCNDVNNEMMPQLAADKSLGDIERDYLNATYHFDRSLGEFIKTLPSNTMVFITSDHTLDVETDGNLTRKPAFYMAVNTPRTEYITRTVSQASLFPTTLELMGVGFHRYHGVLPSVFTDSIDGSVDAHGVLRGNPTPERVEQIEKAYEVSDLIIKSNYFAQEEK